MFKLLSDLNLTNRFDYDADSQVLASGVTGSWVCFKSNGKVDFPDSIAEAKNAVMVWTESDRAGTGGKFTPDVTETSKLSILSGAGLRGITDQVSSYAGTSVGSTLYAHTDGKLAVCDSAAKEYAAVAVCIKKHASVTVLGTTFSNCVEFITK
tara:strand:- start:148 stop:606 length:459 start_codon:yes stop_codon:yes gene_type:complete